MNTIYIKGSDWDFYFPFFYASLCIFVAALSSLIVNKTKINHETEDYLYV